jgi:molybdopterin molybdotransferase
LMMLADQLRAVRARDSHRPVTPKHLISVDEALTLIKRMAAPAGETETVPIAKGLGRVLAQPVLSRSMAPSFDNAAMDGYAISAASLTGNGPWRLNVMGRVAAGQEANDLSSANSALRIFTGAPIPKGADAVVMQEHVTRIGDFIQLDDRPGLALNIRRAGSDLCKGALVLNKGVRLGARELAACVMAGLESVVVRKPLRVALLVTGDEVRTIGEIREAAQIWDVNTPMLTAGLAFAGVELVACVHGADNLSGLTGQLRDMAAIADLVITTGGISVGEEDHVRPALAALGGELVFSGVAIKPGKPVSFGHLGSAFWLGLPGNPQSAFVTWHVFGRALVHRLMGEATDGIAYRQVVIAKAISRKPGRCEFRPATIAGFDEYGREIVTFEDAIQSACVARLPLTDGLIFLPADAETLTTGSLVTFEPFCHS